MLFGWMDAKLAYLMKFSAKHAALYPAASQILILSDMAATITGSAYVETNTKRMLPVVELLVKNGVFTENPPKMLFHVLSAGGAAQLLWLARALRNSPQITAPNSRPPTGIIFDSAPGALNFHALHHIMTMSLAGYQKILGSAGALALIIILKMHSAFSGRPVMHQFIHSGLIAPRILEWTDKGTPRLYVYSDGDRLALVGDVREHVARAQEAGLAVRVEEFRGSGHVGHATADPERYWSAVQFLWGDVVRAKL
ncbi:hypothetical protein DFH07DRAFT_444401 [Mycena maculata]|uniref:DUF829-domain-containing protein n=1 Tax=Mycena maculata TaxID=230809 RepID=A0AAD7J9W4_9AGAR|nr:hypothetical protein DFH07DRAFT_444401 [Mycena maculata]